MMKILRGELYFFVNKLILFSSKRDTVCFFVTNLVKIMNLTIECNMCENILLFVVYVVRDKGLLFACLSV